MPISNQPAKDGNTRGIIMRYHITLKSSNAKTGRIPVTTSSEDTCPDTCPLYGGGCYAKQGHLAMHWRKVSEGSRSIDWNALVSTIASLPAGQLWRHNQAGDLPHNAGIIDADKVAEMVQANQGKRGFTYTHHDVETNAHNRKVVAQATLQGFTVNLSANNLGHADTLASLDIAPVAVVLPSHQVTNTKTPGGRPVIVCPATIRDDVTCESCKLCSVSGKRRIIGFPAHGSGKVKADLIAISG